MDSFSFCIDPLACSSLQVLFTYLGSQKFLLVSAGGYIACLR